MSRTNGGDRSKFLQLTKALRQLWRKAAVEWSVSSPFHLVSFTFICWPF